MINWYKIFPMTSLLGTPSIPTLSRLSANGRLWVGGSSIGPISVAKWLNWNIKDLSPLWKGKIRRLGGWVKYWDDKRGTVTKSKYKSFVTSLERADKKTGWVGKKLIVHLPISVTKWVWMVSLNYPGDKYSMSPKSITVSSACSFLAILDFLSSS